MTCDRCKKRQGKVMLWTLPEQTLELVCNICNRRAIKNSDYHSIQTISNYGTLSDSIGYGIFQ